MRGHEAILTMVRKAFPEILEDGFDVYVEMSSSPLILDGWNYIVPRNHYTITVRSKTKYLDDLRFLFKFCDVEISTTTTLDDDVEIESQRIFY